MNSPMVMLPKFMSSESHAVHSHSLPLSWALVLEGAVEAALQVGDFLMVLDGTIRIEEEEKIKSKQLASKRLLAARRAIEEHKEALRLAEDIDQDAWFGELE